MTSEFKMQVMIVCATGDAVCFKHDGERFDQMNTVKLNADTEYELRFTFQPAVYIENLMINGEILKLEQVERNNHDDEDLRTYRALFKTVGYDVSKKGRRTEFSLVLELQNRVYLKFSLQCKVYRSGENNHAHWGQKLAVIDMNCKLEPGFNYVTIVKEKYL